MHFTNCMLCLHRMVPQSTLAAQLLVPRRSEKLSASRVAPWLVLTVALHEWPVPPWLPLPVPLWQLPEFGQSDPPAATGEGEMRQGPAMVAAAECLVVISPRTNLGRRSGTGSLSRVSHLARLRNHVAVPRPLLSGTKRI